MAFSSEVFVVRFSSLCRKNGLSPRKALSSIFGMDVSNLVRWRACESMPKADLVSAIADYFHVSSDYLLGRELPSEISSVENYTPEEYDLIISLRMASRQTREMAIASAHAILGVESKQKEFEAAEAVCRSDDSTEADHQCEKSE